ncbi:hypothetical protein [Kitasatospora sp. NPDC058046]|uniref:hypothetical protein n=1 Tax=Kitasatospora sp. NPDC058046 TaxID=3346312 RepID=UPI0036DC9A51
MGHTTDWAAELGPADSSAIEEALDFVRSTTPEDLPGRILRGLDEDQLSAVTAHCSPDHVAAMVFPPSRDRLVAALRNSGLKVEEPVPSVVVRDRLARRHRIPLADLDLSILRIALPQEACSSMSVELFVLPVPTGSPLTAIAVRERTERTEHHLAFSVRGGDEAVLDWLRCLFGEQGTLLPESGGFNPGEDSTVFYYRTDRDPNDLGYHRLELRVPGRHPRALASHLASEMRGGTATSECCWPC